MAVEKDGTGVARFEYRTGPKIDNVRERRAARLAAEAKPKVTTKKKVSKKKAAEKE